MGEGGGTSATTDLHLASGTAQVADSQGFQTQETSWTPCGHCCCHFHTSFLSAGPPITITPVHTSIIDTRGERRWGRGDLRRRVCRPYLAVCLRSPPAEGGGAILNCKTANKNMIAKSYHPPKTSHTNTDTEKEREINR